MATSFLQDLVELLAMEAAAEKRAADERRQAASSTQAEVSGLTLIDLAIDDEEPGLGQQYLLTLVKRNRTLELPWNRLRGGMPVLLSEQTTHESVRAVVVRRDRASIQVAVGDLVDGDDFRLDLASDEITRRRQTEALRNAEAAERGRFAKLRDILLGHQQPSFGERPEVDFFSNLSPSQRSAVEFALSADDVCVIHGPPGTGKTTTVVEVIRQLVAREETVLACGPSNHAADHLAVQLSESGVEVVRVGHPARVQAHLQDLTLDAKVAQHERVKIARNCLRDAMKLQRKADRYTRARPEPGQKRSLRNEARELMQEARQHERKAVQEVLESADVICGTTTVDPMILADREFDTLVIDEACQSTEPGSWVPLRYAQRIILAGDHCQLPPTVMSAEAERKGLSVSLQQRLVSLFGEKVYRRLTTQYRMHAQIMQFSSDQFYDGDLEAASGNERHTLCQLEDVEDSEITSRVMDFYDTSGADFHEEVEVDGESRLNRREADFVMMKVQQLLDANVSAKQIGVITPYSAQVRLLKSMSPAEPIEIDTVDGFQGREKEAIVFSAVRSNRQRQIGFLADRRRMNVAITRARRRFILVGDAGTLGGHAFYDELFDYLQEIEAYRSVWEEPPE